MSIGEIIGLWVGLDTKQSLLLLCKLLYFVMFMDIQGSLPMMSLGLCLELATKVESNQGTKLKANGRFGDEQEKKK